MKTENRSQSGNDQSKVDIGNSQREEPFVYHVVNDPCWRFAANEEPAPAPAPEPVPAEAQVVVLQAPSFRGTSDFHDLDGRGC